MGILALIPFKDYFYGAIIVLLLAFGVHEVNHLKAEGAAHEVAALKVSSDKLVAQEAAHVALVAKNYAASAAATTETLNAQIETANAKHTIDAQRLQDFDAYRRQHPSVASASQPTAAAGTGGTGQSQDLISQLGSVGVALADALRDSSAALNACMADRNALTGKP